MFKFIILFTALGITSPTWAASGDKLPKLELNGFIGRALKTPDSLNQKIKDNNVVFDPEMKEIKDVQTLGFELMYAPTNRWQIGGRYTLTAAAAGKVNIGGYESDVGIRVDEAALVSKYNLYQMGRTRLYGGLTGGVSTQFRISNVVPGGSEYFDSSVPILRAFLGTRLNLGFVGLIAEGGYMRMQSSNAKNTAGDKMTVSAGTSDIDLSGLFFVGGIGFQF